MFGDGVEQLDIQLGVVLGKRLMAVMVDELHHRAEGQRVGEAVLSLPMEDLDQLVVASLSEGVHTHHRSVTRAACCSPVLLSRMRGSCKCVCVCAECVHLRVSV